MGFALCGAASLTLLTAAPTLAQGVSASSMMGAVPLAIAVGAGAFALLATAVVRRIIRDGKLAQHRAGEQIASLRALVVATHRVPTRAARCDARSRRHR